MAHLTVNGAVHSILFMGLDDYKLECVVHCAHIAHGAQSQGLVCTRFYDYNEMVCSRKNIYEVGHINGAHAKKNLVYAIRK